LVSLSFSEPVVGQTGTKFQTEYERLIKTYAVYKGYPEQTVPTIEARLSPDRLNTLKAVVRAGLSDLQPGGPLIALVEGVQGIWGVRPGNKEGKHQFRLSVRLRTDAPKILDGSGIFRSAGGAHVLMPVQKGGDDDPAYTGFRVRSDAKTWRQIVDEPPRLQISHLVSDERTGEIDIDFHELRCHFNPSNSDAASLKDSRHSHLELLNKHYVFRPDLIAACHNVDSHCRDSYKPPYCR
jgi:hypothetical protein